jgi:hypothetical protein
MRDDVIDLSSAVARQPMTEAAEAYSSATFERVDLPGGRRLFVKRLPIEGDFMTHVTGGKGRLRKMWTSGLLHRVGVVVDHTILDVRVVDEQDVVIMRDATSDLVPPRTPVSRETSRRLIAGLAGMHGSMADEAAGDLCPIEARYTMCAPEFHATYDRPGPYPMADRIAEGWRLFAENVDPDVVREISLIHRDASKLGDRLRQFPSTLLHGDPKLENLGLAGRRLVAIDWGELTGIGPREIDVAWYAHKGCVRIGCTPDEVFSDYGAESGEPLDEQALDLACVGALAQMGFRFAAGAFASGPEPAPVARAQLDWWTARVRASLDRVGSI